VLNRDRTAPGTTPARGGLWAVVLAGGEGRRLAPLTAQLYGAELPKQFAVLDGRRSLLQTTLERIAGVVPRERTLVVVARDRAELARGQLARFPGVELVLQPRNLGTGPGLLLPLSRVLARDRAAVVAVFPSDHHVSRPDRLVSVVRDAGEAAERGRPRLLLLGAAASRAETDYGWILPGRQLDPRRSLCTVAGFVEKPGPAAADQLLRAGALWNTFILVGRVVEFWAQLRRFLPDQTLRFEQYLRSPGRPEEDRILDSIYSGLEPADFSRDVLQKASGLGVLPLGDCGWSDLGTPARVVECLRRESRRHELSARLRAAVGALADCAQLERREVGGGAGARAAAVAGRSGPLL
jgi:mannose-1-phosphate guanylyltransferase